MRRLLAGMAFVRLSRMVLIIVFIYTWVKKSAFYPYMLMAISISEILGLECYISSMVSEKNSQKWKLPFLLSAIFIYALCEMICITTIFGVFQMEKAQFLITTQDALTRVISDIRN